MEQKTKALKTASRVVAIISKIGYIAMIVALCLFTVLFVLMAITGGDTSITTPGGTLVTVADKLSLTTAEMIILSVGYFVLCGFMLAIFRLEYRLFHEIYMTGDPFQEHFVKRIRTIGILIVASSIAVGLAGLITPAIVQAKSDKIRIQTPGLIVGVIIYCLSYVVDYGCALKDRQAARARK